ncbi:hypothetical protein GCM10007962_18620 [Yeosuana aromativorans]|uniref:DinB family protein n=2 Tax=Yeosuana aromativorans TaxID=288019 RepID=A0A8J3FIB8_9FLAO|nr:hypothetical protein GCM10007962_18620 [Yeosuana aromativorans]
MQSQTKLKTELPYYEIPDYPESFTAGSVAARMLDGLGFRYYWATEGLRIEDLAFRPNDMARTTAETIDHIYGLSQVIVNATLKKSNDNNNQSLEMSFEEKRKQTLQNIKTAADILRTSDDISQFKLIFGTREFPFWNNLNGPIEDAVWHCGQIVSFRRSSGNPYNSKASVFTGKVKN